MSTMRAAVMHGRRDIRVTDDVTKPDPAAGEILVRVTVVGVCGTDAAEYNNGPEMFPISRRSVITGHHGPMIPGHELAGVVVDIADDVTGYQIGDLVVSGAGISCGSCPMCRAGRTNLCHRYASVGLQRDGGLAQYCAVPAATCLRTEPHGVSGDVAGLAQPMAVAVHAVRRGDLQRAERALIVGTGGIGVFATWAAAQLGAHVTVCDLDEDRLSVARSLGAATTVLIEPDQQVQDCLADHGPWDVVYEASGTPAGLSGALALTRTGGRVVLIGLQHQPVPADVRRIVLSELSVIGTNAHVYATDLPAALDLLAARPDSWSDVAPLVLSLRAAAASALDPQTRLHPMPIKVLVDPWIDNDRPFAGPQAEPATR